VGVLRGLALIAVVGIIVFVNSPAVPLGAHVTVLRALSVVAGLVALSAVIANALKPLTPPSG
jgi:hypothetical protein